MDIITQIVGTTLIGAFAVVAGYALITAWQERLGFGVIAGCLIGIASLIGILILFLGGK